MKKLLLIILSAVFVSSAFAGNFDGKGVISGWKFAPVQVGVGIFNSTNLFDADSVALFSIGLAGIQQHSSIISVGGITELKNNYGVQVAAASLTDRNYGLMIGLENCAGVDENYGLKVGLFNISGKFNKGQFAGIDFFEYLHIGIINYHALWQIGLINASEKCFFQVGLFNAAGKKGKNTNFQIGLLNYNSKSYIPWLPLVNFSFGGKEK